MTLPAWLQALQTVGVAALEMSPLGAIAEPVAAILMALEGLSGATGAQKLSQAVAIIGDGSQIAKTLGVNINPVTVQSAVAGAISVAVLVSNIVSQAKTPAAAVAAQSTAVDPTPVSPTSPVTT